MPRNPGAVPPPPFSSQVGGGALTGCCWEGNAILLGLCPGTGSGQVLFLTPTSYFFIFIFCLPAASALGGALGGEAVGGRVCGDGDSTRSGVPLAAAPTA